VTMLASSGVVLGAWYLFTMMRRLLFGRLKEPEGKKTHDLLPRELLLIAPLVILCVFLGVFPQPVLRAAQPDVDMVSHIADLARQRAGLVRTPEKTTAEVTPGAAEGK
jgi:NADH-quinone oxidoreductase subunit M